MTGADLSGVAEVGDTATIVSAVPGIGIPTSGELPSGSLTLASLGDSRVVVVVVGAGRSRVSPPT